jgi:hypothetical protein
LKNLLFEFNQNFLDKEILDAQEIFRDDGKTGENSGYIF